MAEEIEEVDAALVETLASVELIEEDIAKKKDQIEETTREYEEAQAVEQAQYESMKLRIKFMYEKGDTNYLQLLLESQNFSDMVNKAEYVESLYEYDRKLLEEYKIARETVAALKQKLEDEMAELEAQEHELMEEKASLEAILEEKQRTYDNYEVQLAQAKQEAAIYKANIKKQNDEIRRIEAEVAKKQSEIDTAKRLEEEAKKPRSWLCRMRRPKIPAAALPQVLPPREVLLPAKVMHLLPAIPVQEGKGSRLPIMPASLLGTRMYPGGQA